MCLWLDSQELMLLYNYFDSVHRKIVELRIVQEFASELTSRSWNFLLSSSLEAWSKNSLMVWVCRRASFRQILGIPPAAANHDFTASFSKAYSHYSSRSLLEFHNIYFMLSSVSVYTFVMSAQCKVSKQSWEFNICKLCSWVAVDVQCVFKGPGQKILKSSMTRWLLSLRT